MPCLSISIGHTSQRDEYYFVFLVVDPLELAVVSFTDGRSAMRRLFGKNEAGGPIGPEMMGPEMPANPYPLFV